MNGLSIYEQEILKKGSTSAVESYIADIKNNFELQKKMGIDQTWLLENNIYTTNCVNQIREDIESTKELSCNNQLGEYIAISSILHCVDGWSNLGRSLACHNSGDAHNAIHLAYYAELRAAMSILAIQGIGIFDDRHFVIDQNKKCILLAQPNQLKSKRTHTIVWLALKFWSEQKDSRDLLKDVITPFDISLKDWFFAIQRVEKTNEESILGKFLLDWGMDLDLFIGDRSMRNDLSYRPTKISDRIDYHLENNLNFLESFWSVFEPSQINRFENLDKFLILYTIDKIFNKERIPSFEDEDDNETMNYEKKVELLLKIMRFSPTKTQTLNNFFCDLTQKQTNILSESTKRGFNPNKKIEQTPIISRAALLLRVATGLCSRLLERTELSKDELNFWWYPLGVERGLWKHNNVPEDFTDLWADIESALEETKRWNLQNRENHSSLNDLINSQSQYLIRLSECERIALWGLELESI